MNDSNKDTYGDYENLDNVQESLTTDESEELEKKIEEDVQADANQFKNIDIGQDNSGGNLDPDMRVGMAIYMSVLNEGIMTEHGALLPQGLNMPLVAKQAEVSLNYAIKSAGNIRKQGYIKNRKEDGRILIKLTELEEWLTSNGAPLD